jgi:hypothetical protein
LRSYHDRVPAVGGSLYAPVPRMQNDDQQQFVEALLATSGDVVCYCNSSEQEPAKQAGSFMKIRAKHPALYLDSTRLRIPTQDDSKFYSFLRISSDKSERVLAVFNFQPTPKTVRVDLGAINGHELTDLSSNSRTETSQPELVLSLSPYDYRLFSIR